MSTKILLLACLAATHLAAADAAATASVVVPASAAETRPLTVGSAAPASVVLHRPDGTAVTLGAAMQGSPTVVVFYRGGWCPFCTRHLAGLAGVIPDLTAAGWTILAVAPDQPAVLAATLATGDDGVPRLSDAGGDLMRAFGVAFRVDDDTDAKLKGFKVDLAAMAGNTHRWLPVPSVFLIAADGAIRFVHADPDYKVRLDPQALVAIAKTSAK